MEKGNCRGTPKEWRSRNGGEVNGEDKEVSAGGGGERRKERLKKA